MLELEYGATYKINQSEYPAGTICQCSHTISAHGSRGMVCGALTCECLAFTPRKAEMIRVSRSGEEFKRSA